jgi:superfamily II DNA/RNA helicase
LTSKPLGLKRPSAVQAAVFETIIRGDDDVIVGAETGESRLLLCAVAVACTTLNA